MAQTPDFAQATVKERILAGDNSWPDSLLLEHINDRETLTILLTTRPDRPLAITLLIELLNTLSTNISLVLQWLYGQKIEFDDPVTTGSLIIKLFVLYYESPTSITRQWLEYTFRLYASIINQNNLTYQVTTAHGLTDIYPVGTIINILDLAIITDFVYCKYLLTGVPSLPLHPITLDRYVELDNTLLADDLIDHGTSLSSELITRGFLIALRNGNVKRATSFLQLGADWNIVRTVKLSTISHLSKFIASRAPDEISQQVATAAIIDANVSVLSMLLSYKRISYYTDDGNTPLSYILQSGNIRLLAACLLIPPDINFADYRAQFEAVADPAMQRLIWDSFHSPHTTINISTHQSLTAQPTICGFPSCDDKITHPKLKKRLQQFRQINNLIGPSEFDSFFFNGKLLWLFGDIHVPVNTTGLAGKNASLSGFLGKLLTISPITCDVFLEIGENRLLPKGYARELLLEPLAGARFSSHLDDVNDKFGNNVAPTRANRILCYPNVRNHTIDIRFNIQKHFDTITNLRSTIPLLIIPEDVARKIDVSDLPKYTGELRIPLGLAAIFTNMLMITTLLAPAIRGDMAEVAKIITAILAPLIPYQQHPLLVNNKLHVTAQQLDDFTFWPKVAKQLINVPTYVQKIIIDSLVSSYDPIIISRVENVNTVLRQQQIVDGNIIIPASISAAFMASIIYSFTYITAPITDLYTLARLSKVIFAYQDSRMIIFYAGELHIHAYNYFLYLLGARHNHHFGCCAPNVAWNHPYVSSLELPSASWQQIISELERQWTRPTVAKVSPGPPVPTPLIPARSDNMIGHPAIDTITRRDNHLIAVKLLEGNKVDRTMLKFAIFIRNVSAASLFLRSAPLLTQYLLDIDIVPQPISADYLILFTPWLVTHSYENSTYVRIARQLLYVGIESIANIVNLMLSITRGSIVNWYAQLNTAEDSSLFSHLHAYIEPYNLPQAQIEVMRYQPLEICQQLFKITKPAQYFIAALRSPYDALDKLVMLNKLQPIPSSILFDLLDDDSVSEIDLIRYISLLVEVGLDIYMSNTLITFKMIAAGKATVVRYIIEKQPIMKNVLGVLSARTLTPPSKQKEMDKVFE